MSDDEGYDRSLIRIGRLLPANTALVRRGIDLADVLTRRVKGADTPDWLKGADTPDWVIAAEHEYEMLGEAIAGGSTITLTFPELSPALTRPTLLDESITAISVLYMMVEPGCPLVDVQAILMAETPNGA